MEWESNIDPVINKCKVEYLISLGSYQKIYFDNLQSGLDYFNNLLSNEGLFFAVFVDYQGYFKSYIDKTISEGITTVIFNSLSIPDFISHTVQDNLFSVYWSKVSPRYFYQISTDKDFNTVLFSDTISVNYLYHSLVSGNYFFRVKSLDDFNNSVYSKVLEFTV